MAAEKRSKDTNQTVSLVILTTKENLGQQNQGSLGKSKTPGNHINTTTFILPHYLQHLIIGFGMSSKSSFPHKTLLSSPVINARGRTSSHTLTTATIKGPPPPLVNQFLSNLLSVRANLTPAKKLPLWKKFQIMKQNFVKISFHVISEDFDIDSHNSDFNTLRIKANVNRELTKKFRALSSYRRKPFVIDTKENGYKNNFSLFPFQNVFKIINPPFRTQTL